MFKDLRSLCVLSLACTAISFAQSPPSAISTGTWTPLIHQPTFEGAVAPILLTDGSVMVHDDNNYSDPYPMTDHWFKLTPDINGSYVNGSWTQLPDTPGYGPLFYASAVLGDGRVIVEGGEYNLSSTGSWTNLGKIYNPVANTWSSLTPPSGWANIGDAQCAVLPDGRFMVANSVAGDFQFTLAQAAILNPTTMAWTAVPIGAKENNYDEEGWTLMPDGTILTLDVENTPNAEKYVISSGAWVQAGQTQTAFTDGNTLGYEMGPAVLRFDGKVFQFGANQHTAIYTPPAIPANPGSWAAGPDLPSPILGHTMGLADGAACLLPTGNILFADSPIDNGPFNSPCFFYETDGTGFARAPDTPQSGGEPSFIVNFLVLPTGQVMETDSSNNIQIYTPVGSPQDAWRPTIATAPTEVAPSTDYLISGTQFNGLSQTNAYGDDCTNASNYPIVRITNRATGHVKYCFTHGHSTMAVATGAGIVSTHFKVPASIEPGDSDIEVVANGIPSSKQEIFVGPPTISSLVPNSASAGDPDTTMTINGTGFDPAALVDWFDASNVETQLSPSSVTASQITVTVPASLLTTVQNCTVKVENPGSFVSTGATFTINPPNHPPVANAGADQTIEATGPLTNFTLDGTASTDADNDPLTYTWYDSSNTQVGTGSTLTLSRAVGVYTFKLTVSDGKASNDDTVQITIQDTTPPVFSAISDVTVTATSNAGAVATFGPFSANDLVDGVVAGTPSPASGSTFAPGSTLVTVSATDAHSNTGYGYFHVNVLYSWSGFLSPFPKQQYKMGANIPVKFALTGASAGITNLVATGYWNNGGANHLIGTFAYNAAVGQYQLNFKTVGVPKGNINIVVQMGDGSVHTIQVILK